MKLRHLLLIILLSSNFVSLCRAQESANQALQATFADLPENDDAGDMFRSFDESLRNYENVCDQIPIEENPAWKVWLARIASTVYGTCIATKKKGVCCYNACKKRLFNTMRYLGRCMSVTKKCRHA